MASGLQKASKPSVTLLVHELINNTKQLLLRELELAKHEIGEGLRKTKSVATSLGIGIAVAGIGIILLVLMLVHLLHAVTDIPLWGSYGIVGGLLTILAGGVLYMAKKKAGEISLAPEQTVETMKEDIRWIKKEMKSEGV